MEHVQLRNVFFVDQSIPPYIGCSVYQHKRERRSEIVKLKDADCSPSLCWFPLIITGNSITHVAKHIHIFPP